MRHLTIITLLLTSLVVFTGAPAFSAQATLKDAVSTLEDGYKALRDVQADFSQRTALGSLKKEQRGSGTLSIKKPVGAPAMFRFNYTEPKQQIVSNGKTVWFYIPENRQVMVTEITHLFDRQNGVPLNYLTGLDRLSRDFNPRLVGRDQKGNYILELTPKRKNRVLRKLEITVAEKSVDKFVEEGSARDPFPVVSSVIYDTSGNRTTIEFSKVRVNHGLSNTIFNFKIPKDVEVIRK